MRAVCVREPGGPEQLEVREVPEPACGPAELLVDVRATALNRADLLQRRGLYPPPPGVTDILGLECAGVVCAVGADCDPAWLGARVMALLPGGGYAERVALPEGMAMRIPERLSFTEAAALPEAFLTAREALFSLGQLQPEQTVLIHAAGGGVGSAAVELARVLGAQVIATAGTPEKLALARRLGAALAVDYRHADFAAATLQATGGAGADVILDFVGASYWDAHEKCLATGGRLVVIGLLGGSKVTLNLGRWLARRWQLLGLAMRPRPLVEKLAVTRAFVRDSLPLFEAGLLEPVVDRVYPLDEVRAAHARMEANENVGKVVLEF